MGLIRKKKTPPAGEVRHSSGGNFNAATSTESAVCRCGEEWDLVDSRGGRVSNCPACGRLNASGH